MTEIASVIIPIASFVLPHGAIMRLIVKQVEKIVLPWKYALQFGFFTLLIGMLLRGMTNAFEIDSAFVRMLLAFSANLALGAIFFGTRVKDSTGRAFGAKAGVKVTAIALMVFFVFGGLVALSMHYVQRS